MLFQPDSIMGKAVKYDINSEAAHNLKEVLIFGHDRLLEDLFKCKKSY